MRQVLVILSGVLVLTASANAQANKFQPVSDLLKQANFAQLVPYGSNYQPGGLVVHCQGTWKYIGLPEGTTYPTPQHQAAVFPAVTGKGQTTFGGLASFLTNALKLNFTATHDSSITLNELTADESYITDGDIVMKQEAVVAKVRQALLPPQNCDGVYEVMAVLTTKALEVTTSSAIGGSIQANGSDLTSCQSSGDAAQPAAGTDKPQTPAAAPAASKSVPSKVTGTSVIAPVLTAAGGALAPTSGKPAAAGVAAAVAAAAPGYGIYGCLSNNSSITLASDSPLAFAIQSNEVTLPKSTTYTLVQGNQAPDSTPPQPALVVGLVPSKKPVGNTINGVNPCQLNEIDKFGTNGSVDCAFMTIAIVERGLLGQPHFCGGHTPCGSDLIQWQMGVAVASAMFRPRRAFSFVDRRSQRDAA